MKSIETLVLFCLLLSLGITSHAKTPDGETPSVEDVCDGQVGAAYGLCTSYCEAMDCDSNEPKASEVACNRVLENFIKKTGSDGPPCDPCAGLGECPCDFDLVPKTMDCWPGDPVGEWIIFDLPGLISCKLRETTGNPTFFELFGEDDYVRCVVKFEDTLSDDCFVDEFFGDLTSDAQRESCICRLENYAEELNTIVGEVADGPFICP